jgi:hypothetical protein
MGQFLFTVARRVGTTPEGQLGAVVGLIVGVVVGVVVASVVAWAL